MCNCEETNHPGSRCGGEACHCHDQQQWRVRELIGAAIYGDAEAVDLHEQEVVLDAVMAVVDPIIESLTQTLTRFKDLSKDLANSVIENLAGEAELSGMTPIRHHDDCISRSTGPHSIYCDCRTLYMIEARASLIAETERDAALERIIVLETAANKTTEAKDDNAC